MRLFARTVWIPWISRSVSAHGQRPNHKQLTALSGYYVALDVCKAARRVVNVDDIAVQHVEVGAAWKLKLAQNASENIAVIM